MNTKYLAVAAALTLAGAGAFAQNADSSDTFIPAFAPQSSYAQADNMWSSTNTTAGSLEEQEEPQPMSGASHTDVMQRSGHAARLPLELRQEPRPMSGASRHAVKQDARQAVRNDSGASARKNTATERNSRPSRVAAHHGTT